MPVPSVIPQIGLGKNANPQLAGRAVPPQPAGGIQQGSIAGKGTIWFFDNGVPFPRNPSGFDVQWDRANVTYEPMADGSQTRVMAPRLLRGADVTMAWDKADNKIQNFILNYLSGGIPPGNVRKMFMGGYQPFRYANIYLDTPQKTMATDSYNSKWGEGGFRTDFKITCRMDDTFYSWFSVPTGTGAQDPMAMASQFGGWIGNGTDGIPVYDGCAWAFAPGSSRNGMFTIGNFMNLGTAPWFPVILIKGPFLAGSVLNPPMTLQNSADIDGTGQGCQWQWTGNALLVNDFLLFDTKRLRVWKYTAATGILAEVYTWKLYAVSSGLPFGFWSPYYPGVNSIEFLATGMSSATTFDLSNNASEHFPYV